MASPRSCSRSFGFSPSFRLEGLLRSVLRRVLGSVFSFDRVLASFGFWEPVLLPWFGTSRLSFSFLVPLVGLPRAFFSFRSPFWIPGFGLPEQDSMVVAVAPRWVRSPFRTVHRTWCRRSKEAPLPRRRKGYGSGRIVTHQEKTRTKSVGESKESPPVVRTLWYRTSWTFRALLGANFDRSSLDRNVRPSYGKPNEGSEALRTYGAQAFLRYEGDSVAARDQSVPWRTRAFDPFVPESREDSQTPKRGVLSQRFGGIPHGLVPSWVSKAHCLPSRPIPSEEPRYVPGVGKALAPETVRSLSVPKPLGMRKGSAPCLPFGLRRAFRKPKSGKGTERCLRSASEGSRRWYDRFLVPPSLRWYVRVLRTLLGFEGPCLAARYAGEGEATIGNASIGTTECPSS